MRRSTHQHIAVLLLLAAACGGDTAPAPPPVAATLEIVRGNGQTGPVGDALPEALVARALDASGHPVPGTIVGFAVTAGGGKVTAATDTTDATGTVSTNWTIGTIADAPQTLVATVVSSAGSTVIVPPLAFSATAVSGLPDSLIAAASLTGRVGDTLAPLVVSLRDQYGNRTRTPGVSVRAHLDGLSQTVLQGVSVVQTDAEGSASFRQLVTTGRAASGALVIESNGLKATRVTLMLSGGKATHVDSENGASLDAVARGSGPPVAVRVTDDWQNPVAGTEVTFLLDGQTLLGRATSDALGIATLRDWTAPAAGTHRVSATIAGSSSVAVFSLSTHSGVPSSLSFFDGGSFSATVGTSLTFAVRAVDAIGNPVLNTQLAWSLANGPNGQIATDETGVARFGFFVPTRAGANQLTVRSLDNNAATVSSAVTGVAGPFYQVQPFYETLELPAGSTVPIALTTSDQYENPVRGVTLFALLGGDVGGSMSPATATSDANGRVNFTGTLGTLAGMTYFSVNPNGRTDNAYATKRVYVSAARGTLVPAALFLGCSASINSIGFFSELFQANGHPAVGVPITVTASPGNGVLSTSATTTTTSITSNTDGSGMVPLNWLIPGPSGTYRLTVTAPAGYANSPGTVTCVKP